ncbi:MAG: DUF3568 family protein [Planctomycetes bacterium]|nr:DUF3568 family protein [Planctomycetota bacterium]
MKYPVGLAGMVLLMAGCRGMGEKPATEVNTVDREYAQSTGAAWPAVVDTVKGLDLRIERDRHDELGGDLLARRGDGSEVTIIARAVDLNRTRIGVRVGSGDRSLAVLIHERIARELGMGQARDGEYGGESVRADYPVDFRRGLAIARDVMASLNLWVTSEEVRSSAAELNGRRRDSSPVQIRLESLEGQGTRISFLVGADKTQDNLEFARRLKHEFELRARPLGP